MNGRDLFLVTKGKDFFYNGLPAREVHLLPEMIQAFSRLGAWGPVVRSAIGKAEERGYTNAMQDYLAGFQGDPAVFSPGPARGVPAIEFTTRSGKGN